MNEEVILSNWAGVKLLVLAVIGWLYSRAGRGIDGYIWGIKIRRRVILPAILVGAWLLSATIQNIFTLKFLLVTLLTYPIMYLSMSVGYGGNTLPEKIFRRGAYGLALGVAPIAVAWYFSLWNMLIVNILVNVLCSVYLGIKSGITASYEEALLSVFQFAIPIFLI